MTKPFPLPNPESTSPPSAASTTPCPTPYTTMDAGAAPQSDRVVLRYKTRGARATLFALAGLAPVWALWAPYAALSVMKTAQTDQESLVVLCLSLFLLDAAVLSIWACLDTELVIDSKGIRFPYRFL